MGDVEIAACSVSRKTAGNPPSSDSDNAYISAPTGAILNLVMAWPFHGVGDLQHHPRAMTNPYPGILQNLSHTTSIGW
jgi:hypothetical protein